MFISRHASTLTGGADEHACDLKFSNVLAYLGCSLMLDIEGNTDSSLADCGDRPPLAMNGRWRVTHIINHSSLTSLCQTPTLRSMDESFTR